ncbi:aminotransferase class I/II-fold pyridoxal phosphate-dependent enzyme [Bacillus tianshenii]|nr:aminotransferase class I/II-fold pyridoxal phosphate-dependent enzyme [Bacillus tianshenii]
MKKMDQQKTPIYSRLKAHWETDPVSGHVPGHKYGRVLPEKGQAFFRDILKIDATEISGLDDLHSPEEMIKEGQELVSDLYGSDASFFLVNGSTVGNLAMILSVCSRGDRVLVQRNCHKSVLNGLELAGAEPVFLSCGYDPMMEVSTSVELDELDEALKTIEDVQAVILTNPNYYGLSIDLKAIIERVHEAGIPVLVDEAHGAHFVLGSPFPVSALELGADVVVHSAHKTLPAMTMGSFLHIKGSLVSRERIAYYLRMLQSSSPSYPIMASLDLARSYIAALSKEEIDAIAKETAKIRRELDMLDGIRVVVPENKSIAVDPLKVVIRSTSGRSGFELQRDLEREGVFSELADAWNVLIVLPLAVMDAKHDMIERIERALQENAGGTTDRRYTRQGGVPLFPKKISQLAIQLDQQQELPSMECKLEDAIGRVAAESVVPYPPGIPVLLKGERVTEEVVEYLGELTRLGARFQGNERMKSNYISIYKEVKE